MSDDARDDLYAVAALLDDLDRVLNPLPFEERGDLGLAPTIPPPLPPGAPRGGSRSPGTGAPPRRAPTSVATQASPPMHAIRLAAPSAAKDPVTPAAPAPSAHAPASSRARRAVAESPLPTTTPVAPSTSVPVVETRPPDMARPATGPSPPAAPRRPFRGVVPPGPPCPTRDPAGASVPAARPRVAEVAPPPAPSAPERQLARPGPRPRPAARASSSPAVAPTTIRPTGGVQPAPAAPGSSPPSSEHATSLSARDRRPPRTPPPAAAAPLAPPALPRGTGHGRVPGRNNGSAVSARPIPRTIDTAVGAESLDSLDDPTAVAAPLDAVYDRALTDEPLILFDDDVDDGGPPTPRRRWSGVGAHFWLRGGRVRVTGPAVALARAERRLAARWGLRYGRRL